MGRGMICACEPKWIKHTAYPSFTAAGPNATVSLAINGSTLSSLSVAFPGAITIPQIAGYLGFK